MINNGNHYHPADGVFVAPISGVYMFAWNIITYNIKGLHAELRVESEVKGSVGSYAGINQFIPGSATLLWHVKKRRTRLGRNSGGTTDNYMHDWRDSTSFMGILLQKD